MIQIAIIEETRSRANVGCWLILNEWGGWTMVAWKRRKGSRYFLTNGRGASGKGRALYVTLWGGLIANESLENSASNPRRPFRINLPARCQQRTRLTSDPPTQYLLHFASCQISSRFQTLILMNTSEASDLFKSELTFNLNLFHNWT